MTPCGSDLRLISVDSTGQMSQKVISQVRYSDLEVCTSCTAASDAHVYVQFTSLLPCSACPPAPIGSALVKIAHATGCPGGPGGMSVSAGLRLHCTYTTRFRTDASDGRMLDAFAGAHGRRHRGGAGGGSPGRAHHAPCLPLLLRRRLRRDPGPRPRRPLQQRPAAVHRLRLLRRHAAGAGAWPC